VLVVDGAARLSIEGEQADRELSEGDWILLPAHCRHRVTWTRAEPSTVWLAIYFR
jgi:cupin 2 domain-containing protein